MPFVFYNTKLNAYVAFIVRKFISVETHDLAIFFFNCSGSILMTGRRHMSQKREKGDLTLTTLNDNCGIRINVGRKLPTCYSFLFVCLQERDREIFHLPVHS